MEHTIELVKLYKEGKITDYALEAELSKALGDRSEVKLVSITTTSTSFGIFMTPVSRINGLFTIFYVDKNAIMNLYNAEDFVNVLLSLREIKQTALKKYNDFINETKAGVLTRGIALGNYLSIYLLEFSRLNIGNFNFLPKEDYVATAAIELKDEKDTESNIENLKIMGVLFDEIIAEADKISHDSNDDEYYTILSISKKEKPSQNIGFDQIRAVCTNTFGGEYEHKEIDPNYKPETNQ